MMDRDESIREATIDDAAALASLTGELGYPTDEPSMWGRLSLILGRDDWVTFVAERSGGIVGYAGAWCGPGYEADALRARIMAIVVERSERRRGTATRLMAAIETWARERDAATIVLESGDHRSDAHVFYERLGYQATGRRYIKRFDG